MRPENFFCLLQILTANAVDWARRVESPRIRIVVACDRGDHCEIVFSDNGPGIPLDIVGRIFEPLFSRKEGGRGMGLTIARQLVEAHGGRISADHRRPPATGRTSRSCCRGSGPGPRFTMEANPVPVGRRVMAEPRPTVIDLFCGAGGFSLGFHAAGCRILAAVDADPMAAETYRTNFARLQPEDSPRVFSGDEGDLDRIDLEAILGWTPDIEFLLRCGSPHERVIHASSMARTGGRQARRLSAYCAGGIEPDDEVDAACVAAMRADVDGTCRSQGGLGEGQFGGGRL